MNFEVLYGDPAWKYRDRALAGKRGAGCKYKVMSIEDIKYIRYKGKLIREITAPNCVLFLWVTFPILEEIFTSGLLKAWGFEYKTVAFTWVKKYKNGNTFMGMGNWTRSNAEICLLAVKGKPKRINAGIRQIVESVPEGHSKKPDEVRERIEKLCGKTLRLELFARQKTKGWSCHGDELSKV